MLKLVFILNNFQTVDNSLWWRNKEIEMSVYKAIYNIYWLSFVKQNRSRNKCVYATNLTNIPKEVTYYEILVKEISVGFGSSYHKNQYQSHQVQKSNIPNNDKFIVS